MYKIDRRGGVQKSYTRTDPIIFNMYKYEMSKNKNNERKNATQKTIKSHKRKPLKIVEDDMSREWYGALNI